MPKVEIEQIEHTAKSVGIEAQKVDNLIIDLKESIEQEKELKDGQPREKKQFLVIANTSHLSEEDAAKITETPMVVVQFPEDGDHNEVIQGVVTAARSYNIELKESPKKKSRRKPVEKILEAISAVQAKFFKNEGIVIKTKEPVIVVTTDNEIPKVKEAEQVKDA